MGLLWNVGRGRVPVIEGDELNRVEVADDIPVLRALVEGNKVVSRVVKDPLLLHQPGSADQELNDNI